jgi:predicted DCC family thiol-disulfide oxidoreductase YuxK
MNHGSIQQAEANARIIVFDGICHVCSGGVRFLAHHRIEPPFKLIPMQSTEGKGLLVEYGDRCRRSDDIFGFGPGTGPHPVRRFNSYHGCNGRLMAARRGCASDSAFLAGLAVPIARAQSYRWFGRRNTCYLPR